MFRDIEPYPEYKNKIDNNKTALHVASIMGHDKKMKVILNNFEKKYELGLSTSKVNVCIDYHGRYPTKDILPKLLKKFTHHKMKNPIHDITIL